MEKSIVRSFVLFPRHNEPPRLLIERRGGPARRFEDGLQIFIRYGAVRERTRAPARANQLVNAWKRVGEFDLLNVGFCRRDRFGAQYGLHYESAMWQIFLMDVRPEDRDAAGRLVMPLKPCPPIASRAPLPDSLRLRPAHSLRPADTRGSSCTCCTVH